MGLGSNYVPSLFQICVNYLVDNFDHVDSLGLVDHAIRRALCENLVAKGKMNGAAFDVLAEMGAETLELIDCAQVTQDQMCEALEKLLPSGLRAILLKHCGRCFGSQAVKTISEVGREDLELFAISLSGAYLLKDEDVAQLLGATNRTLSSIELVACPLIGMQFCNALGEHFATPLDTNVATGCLLELSLEDIPMKKEALLSLGAASDCLRNLKSLQLKSIEGLDDEVVSIILESITESSLEGIDLSNNPDLTDDILLSIRKCNVKGNLRSLQLSGLKNLSAIGLEAFFTEIPDLPAPPMLRKLDFSHCSFDEINDAVVVLAIKASSFKRTLKDFNGEDVDVFANPEKFDANIIHSLGLVHVNIAGSSVTDKSMEMLAVCCKSSLEELDVSSCTSISDKGLGYLVSKLGGQFSKIHVWGMAQLTEEFLDGHDRVEEGGLEICGVWMKKSGGRSVR
jgi:DNA repair protein RAD7